MLVYATMSTYYIIKGRVIPRAYQIDIVITLCLTMQISNVNVKGVFIVNMCIIFNNKSVLSVAMHGKFTDFLSANFMLHNLNLI